MSLHLVPVIHVDDDDDIALPDEIARACDGDLFAWRPYAPSSRRDVTLVEWFPEVAR